MKILAITLPICMIVACANDTSNTEAQDSVPVKVQEKNLTDGVEMGNKKDYSIDYSLEKIDTNMYELSTSIELKNQAYLVSHFSADFYRGRFQNDLMPNERLLYVGSMTESPAPVEETDVWSGEPVKMIRKNTTYKQKIKVIIEEDFTVIGESRFTIEPSCTYEQVHFNLIYNDGILTVEKAD